MVPRLFHDICSLVMFLKFSNCTRLRPCNFENFKTSLVPIYHEMHSRSYDFLYLYHISYKNNGSKK